MRCRMYCSCASSELYVSYMTPKILLSRGYEIIYDMYCLVFRLSNLFDLSWIFREIFGLPSRPKKVLAAGRLLLRAWPILECLWLCNCWSVCLRTRGGDYDVYSFHSNWAPKLVTISFHNFHVLPSTFYVMTDFPHLVLFSTLRRYWPDFDGNLIGQMSCIKLSLTSNPPGLILLRFAEELGETDPNQLRFLRVMKIARALRGVRVMRLLRYVSSLRAILFSISSTLCRWKCRFRETEVLGWETDPETRHQKSMSHPKMMPSHFFFKHDSFEALLGPCFGP